ncbi:MAG: hypothetical protein IH594_05035 [Bacteroidales bacterium]|nr:hypothetical protein [Bacteroidales bacterium]
MKNIPGWRTARKIVVIECDDWGSIRFPSQEIYNKLSGAGVGVTKGHFRHDTLESAEDLEALFHILNSVRDGNGRGAVMSAITSMANPDFKKIRDSFFREYYYEKYTDTLLRYGRGEEVLNLWEQGVNSGTFIPELHGREHISIQFWLKELRRGNKHLLLAFDNEVVSVEIPGIKPVLQGFRPEFYFDNEEQVEFLKASIRDSTFLFENIFGYKSSVFVPADGIFHPSFDSTIAESAIRYLNVNHFSLSPDGRGNLKHRLCTSGQKSGNLRYYIRNCAFEPSSENYRGIGLTLKQAAAAFRWHKPAIISTHRVNFVGGISQENRAGSLKELKGLLSAIVDQWPDVEFMGSAEALDIMNETNN